MVTNRFKVPVDNPLQLLSLTVFLVFAGFGSGGSETVACPQRVEALRFLSGGGTRVLLPSCQRRELPFRVSVANTARKPHPAWSLRDTGGMTKRQRMTLAYQPPLS
jgi:hypothetical protein